MTAWRLVAVAAAARLSIAAGNEAAPPAPAPMPASTGAVSEAATRSNSPAAALSRDVERSRAEFDRRLQELDVRSAQIGSVWGAAYLSMLKDLRSALQSAGRLRDMVAVHDEVARYERERTLPAPDAARATPEWAAIVNRISALALNESHAVDIEIVETAARHLQTLARAGADAAPTTVAALDAERDRVVGHPRVRAALAGSAAPPPPIPTDAVPPPAAAAAPDKRRLRLAGPPDEEADRAMAYMLDITMTEDRSRMHQSKTQGAPKLGQSHTISGPVAYRFQVVVATRNSELPADCRLVVEYFKRAMVDGSKTYHATEEVKLPAMRRQGSRSFDLKGIELPLTETRTVTQIGSTRNFSGHEFHGLIASIVDPAGKVLFQRFSPQPLGKESVPVPGHRP